MGKQLFWFFLVNALIVATLVPMVEDAAFLAPVIGSAGAFTALLSSRWIAKLRFKIQLIPINVENEHGRQLVEMVTRLSQKAGLPVVPQIGIYEADELNAFATGPSKKRALVAFSSTLLETMEPEEIEGIAAHEIAHIANGDMVTMTLIQAVVNTIVLCVVFPLKALRVASWFSKGQTWWVEGVIWLTEVIAALALTFLGSLVVKAFSRRREYAADAGAARLTDGRYLIRALEILKGDTSAAPKHQLKYAALKISSRGGWLEFFSTHPAIEKRVARLNQISSGLTSMGTAGVPHMNNRNHSTQSRDGSILSAVPHGAKKDVLLRSVKQANMAAPSQPKTVAAQPNDQVENVTVLAAPADNVVEDLEAEFSVESSDDINSPNEAEVPHGIIGRFSDFLFDLASDDEGEDDDEDED